MDIQYTRQNSVKNLIYALWNYYLFIFAPRKVWQCCLAILLFWFAAIHPSDELLIFIAIIHVGLTVIDFPLFAFRMIKQLKFYGVFEHETTIRITSNGIETSCNGNVVNSKFDSFSGYFIWKNTVWMLGANSAFAGAFTLKKMPDDGKEFIELLRENNLKRVSFFTVKRWITPAIALLALGVIIWINIK